ncbi:MAG TPA: inositol monophosphatase family protein [Nevskiaceae bacterium]|nr:inositol monophosphatase family protein [Nevskiaceae bacterium]
MPSPYVLAALEAAAASTQIIQKAYRGHFEMHYKPDATPVTEVDVASERAIKTVLKRHFPAHGFYGEELGREQADADDLWLIDPIDGTKSFVRGYPVFSIQIGLMHRGQLIAGVSCAPCWNAETQGGETLWADVGAGAWRRHADGRDERLHISDIKTLDKAILSTGNLARLAQSPAWARFGALIPSLHRIRGYGDFLHYHWLASGRLDAVIESDVNILDISALAVIVREAGGIFTDLEGRELTLDTRSVLAAVPALHQTLLDTVAFGR